MNGVSREPEGFTLAIDLKIYSLEAIKKTAYRFAEHAAILIQPRIGSEVAVVFQFQNAADRDRIVAAFCTELLDQDLREIVKRETAPIRNLLLAHAFSRTSLVWQE